MLGNLTSRFSQIFTRASRRGRLKPEDINEVLADIREALVDADVNVGVVEKFCEAVREECLAAELHQALNPTEQIIQIVRDQLIAILGGESFSVAYASKPPTVVLLAGLQGSGKTTNAVKLARWFAQQGRQPLLVGADLQRPAAVEQLRVLADAADIPVYSEGGDPVKAASGGVKEARRLGRDVLICDTAGRLSIDQEMMHEVACISKAISPQYTFFVLDAMGGQAAASVAEAFHEALELDGIILTKLDSDARGGAVLSARETVGRPVVFASTGERIGDFELFHPDRMAGRILGKGDVLGLIEKTEEAFEQAEAEAAAERLIAGTYTLDDFLDQMRQIRKLGPLSGLLGRMPGMSGTEIDDQTSEKRLTHMEAIICSMTPMERFKPEIINNSRRQRIAQGSGTATADVSKLIREFTNARKLMQSLGRQPRKAKPGKKGKKGGGRVTPKGTGSPQRAGSLQQGAVSGLDLVKLEEELGIDLSEMQK